MDHSEFPFLQLTPSPSPFNFMYNFLPVPNRNHLRELEEPGLHSCTWFMEAQREYMKLFWEHQTFHMDQVAMPKERMLPLARTKKIMKSDQDVKMVSAAAANLFTEACELFIKDLTIRSWMHVEESKRQILQKSDIASAIYHAEVHDFLVDTVPPSHMKVLSNLLL